MNFVDLVLCEHTASDKKYLFVAPPFTHIPKGTHVIVNTKHGEQEAVVCKSITTEENGEDFDFAVEATGATLPLARVLKVISYRDLKYKEDGEKWT